MAPSFCFQLNSFDKYSRINLETVNYFSTINPIYRLRQGVRFVYPDVAEYCKYPIFTSNTIKDNGKSKKYKKRAIKLYAKGKNDKAMKYIILSVNVCPDTYHLDVSMGGRSLILFVIGDYISALADINRVSFNKRSPENLLLRLKTLKADCIFQLNKKLQELEGFRVSLKLFKKIIIFIFYIYYCFYEITN